MTRMLLSVLVVFVVTPVTHSVCQSDDREDQPFRIGRVETDLQHRLLGDDVDWFVLMDPAAIAVDGDITDDAAGWQKLEDALVLLTQLDAKQGADGEPPGIHILFAFSDETQGLMRQNDRYRRHAAVVIRAAGCRDVNVRDIFTTARLKWQDHVAEFDAPAPMEDASTEPEFGSETVKVYPVRSRLSRYITQGTDCFVDFRKPLDESGGVVAPKSLDEAVSLIAELELEQRRVITFQVTGDFEIPPAKTALEIIGIPDELVTDLGFAQSQVWRR